MANRLRATDWQKAGKQTTQSACCHSDKKKGKKMSKGKKSY